MQRLNYFRITLLSYIIIDTILLISKPEITTKFINVQLTIPLITLMLSDLIQTKKGTPL